MLAYNDLIFSAYRNKEIKAIKKRLLSLQQDKDARTQLSTFLFNYAISTFGMSDNFSDEFHLMLINTTEDDYKKCMPILAPRLTDSFNADAFFMKLVGSLFKRYLDLKTLKHPFQVAHIEQVLFDLKEELLNVSDSFFQNFDEPTTLNRERRKILDELFNDFSLLEKAQKKFYLRGVAIFLFWQLMEHVPDTNIYSNVIFFLCALTVFSFLFVPMGNANLHKESFISEKHLDNEFQEYLDNLIFETIDELLADAQTVENARTVENTQRNKKSVKEGGDTNLSKLFFNKEKKNYSCSNYNQNTVYKVKRKKRNTKEIIKISEVELSIEETELNLCWEYSGLKVSYNQPPDFTKITELYGNVSGETYYLLWDIDKSYFENDEKAYRVFSNIAQFGRVVASGNQQGIVSCKGQPEAGDAIFKLKTAPHKKDYGGFRFFLPACAETIVEDKSRVLLVASEGYYMKTH